MKRNRRAREEAAARSGWRNARRVGQFALAFFLAKGLLWLAGAASLLALQVGPFQRSS
jgi:hypothetical protein